MTTPTSTPKFYALEKSGNNETTVTLYDEIGAFGAGSKEFLADLGKLDGLALPCDKMRTAAGI